jgi:hypothetical protein
VRASATALCEDTTTSAMRGRRDGRGANRGFCMASLRSGDACDRKVSARAVEMGALWNGPLPASARAGDGVARRPVSAPGCRVETGASGVVRCRRRRRSSAEDAGGATGGVRGSGAVTGGPGGAASTGESMMDGWSARGAGVDSRTGLVAGGGRVCCAPAGFLALGGSDSGEARRAKGWPVKGCARP